MKFTGRRCPIESEYDLDHSITDELETLKDQLLNLDDNGKYENKKAIIKAMIETLIEEL